MKGMKTGGRQKGVPNKTTAQAKQAIEECFKLLGDIDGLYAWAKDNKTDFYKIIYPKILPLDVNNNHSGLIKTETSVKHV